MSPKNTPKQYKATCAVGFGYGDTPKEAFEALLFMNPGVRPSCVVVKGLTVRKSEHETWYAYNRVAELELPETLRVFACISDENGILEYAGLHVDLADAVIGYAKEVCMPIGKAYQSDDCTWYEFNVPPKDWEDWNGEMSCEDYDKLCDAADYTYRDAEEAVAEARARRRRAFGGAR